MQIMVNGVVETLPGAMSISAYLEYKAIDTKLVVIEWNFTTPPPGEWARIRLGDGDNLEIIKFIGGG